MKKSILFVVLALLLLAACETRVIMPQPGEQPNTLSVNGASEFEVAPDLAKVRFRVEILSPTAQGAQSKNREIANSVRDALLRAGVRSDELETSDYRVEKVQEWNYEQNKMVEKGYRATNAFVVETKNLESVGTLLDVGVQAGATNVESISFELSEAKQREVKTEALRRAATNAREKAVALAEGSGVVIAKVRTITENSYYVQPFYRADVMAMAESKGGMAAPTPISPGQVQVSAQVSVSYEVA